MDVKERTHTFLCAELTLRERNLPYFAKATKGIFSFQRKMVGLIGLEPMTPALSRRCSNQLSYRPKLVES